jgi:hypothetical protein
MQFLKFVHFLHKDSDADLYDFCRDPLPNFQIVWILIFCLEKCQNSSCMH